MTSDSTLYRVSKLTTGSLQPCDSATHWITEVLYCGYDREEARRVHHENTADEVYYGFGNKVVEINSETIEDSGTDDFADDTVEKGGATCES
jgi:hypothetical protein